MLDRRAFALSLLPGLGLASPPLRMAYFDRYPPLSQREADGRVQGLLIDLVNAAGEQADLRFSHHAYPWARAQAMVRLGQLDGVCTIATEERRQFLLFCDTPLISLHFGICHRLDDRRIAGLRSLADLRALRQGNYRGSGYTQQNLEPEAVQIDHEPDSVLRRIAAGDLDVYVDAELNTRHRIRALGLETRLGYTPAAFLPPSAYCFGLRRSHAQAAGLVARMETAIQQAQAGGRLALVAARYR
jgi:polar amino acid transport system substrate-binding protein